MTTTGARVKQVRKEIGLTQQSLAKAVGIQQPTLSALESGKSNGTSLIASFASALGVNALWLETGRGPKYPVSKSNEESRNLSILIVDSTASILFPKELFRNMNIPENGTISAYISDDSMAPTICRDGIVIINAEELKPIDGKIFAVRAENSGLLIRRMAYEYNDVLKSSVWIMRADNQDKSRYPDKRLPPDDSATIIGRVIWGGNRM